MINKKLDTIYYGVDYYPEQWLDHPEIIEEDFKLMRKANINGVSLGVFSWAFIEPEEGIYNFKWLDEIIEKCEEHEIYFMLATPSGARPRWLAEKYPEVLRVNNKRVRSLFGTRHNHCYTAPIYREKVLNINSLLAERYKDKKYLYLWHVSNEYGGECHCDLCQEAFRDFLKEKYNNDINELNMAWWSGFWAHTYTNWSQLESGTEDSNYGEIRFSGLDLDWKRFVTHQTVNFMKNEIEPLKRITPNIPITTNMMGLNPGLDYWKFKDIIDLASWDSYPVWDAWKDWKDSKEDDMGIMAAYIGLQHNMYRTLKDGKPWLLMETTPSVVNWKNVNNLLAPKLNQLQLAQSIAHGADGVQYFQWRKSRGGEEKFHGAVVGHSGGENTRVFRECTQVGIFLKNIREVVGSTITAEVAIVYDWENNWAINCLQGWNNESKAYQLGEACRMHYTPFWQMGIPVDTINSKMDFSKYKLIIAPFLYMLLPGVAEKIEKYVREGGTLVTTCGSGIVNETDLCFLNGGPLRKVFGLYSEEMDVRAENETNTMVTIEENELNLKKEYELNTYFDQVVLDTAQIMGTYKTDFYEGNPALTVNKYGNGKCYYIAAKVNREFIGDFYKGIVKNIKIDPILNSEIPKNVSVQIRAKGKYDYIFIMNFSQKENILFLDDEEYFDIINQKNITRTLKLASYGVAVLRRHKIINK